MQELRVGSHDPAPPPVPLGLQVANSVVADHLRGCGYQYTLSTFLPESHTDLHTVSRLVYTVESKNRSNTHTQSL